MENNLRLEMISLAEQAIGHLNGGATGHQYDPSWIRPRSMTRQDIQTSCEQAYHLINKIKEKLENAQ